MNRQDAIEKIHREGWFKGIDLEKIGKVVDVSHFRNYSPGEFVYLVGDRQDHVFFILEGRIKLSIVSQEGDEFVLTMWDPGRWFGESAFLQGSTMPLEARALKKATLLAVPTNVIDKVLADGSSFYSAILHDTIRRANQLYSLVEMLLFKPLRVRVVARMLHLTELFGEHSDAGIVLPLEFSQSDFARMSGGSRQRINKIFREWAKDDIVIKRGKNHIIRDIDALRQQLNVTEDD